MSSPAVSPFPLPPITITTLFAAGRSMLLDPVVGPSVAPPGNGTAAAGLQEVRVRGNALDPTTGEQIGTIGWSPADSPTPWGMLSSYRKKLSYKETYHAWEDWDAAFYLGLAAAGDYDQATSMWTWAEYWDTELTQWFAGHRRFGTISNPAGDVYWQLNQVDVSPFLLGGVACFGLVCALHVHNVVPITWGV